MIHTRIETSELKKALATLGTVINPKNSLPILGDVLLRYDPERKHFLLMASNSEQWLSIDCLLPPDDNGNRKPWLLLLDDTNRKDPFTSICIGYQTLREAIGTLPAMPIQAFIDTEKLTMRVDYQTGEFTIPVEPATEFPQMPTVTANDSTDEQKQHSAPLARLDIDTKWLLSHMQAARVCVASDELRPVMNTECLDLFHDHCVLVASDGHTLYREVRDTGMGYLQYGNFSADQSATLLIPSAVIGTVIKAFAPSEHVTITADTQRLRFEADGTTLVTVTIDGHYPNYESVIPKNQPHAVRIDRQTMQAVLRRISIFANESSNMATLQCDGDYLHIQAEDYDFSRSGQERIAVSQADNRPMPPASMKFGLKIATLAALLPAIRTDECILEISDPSRALTLREADGNSGLTLLQMPMLVNN